MNPLITLTTDFGTQDAYASVLKGVILSINPRAQVIDITHDIAPQDVMEGAFVLGQAIPYFPEGTIHLVVVDPGVGTRRRAVALRHGANTFVGPDNGLFSLLLKEQMPDQVVELDNPAYWRAGEISQTFHGRDIFAPVAAHLSTGIALDLVGRSGGDLQPLRWALPVHDAHSLRGWIAHVDRFGNGITNIARASFETVGKGRPLQCHVGNTMLYEVHETYGKVDAGEAVLLFGSSGFLEVAVNAGNAASLLDIRKGSSVHIIFHG